MVKVLYTTDLHGNNILYDKLVEFLKKNKSITALIIGGDLCPHGSGTLDDGIKQQREFIENFLIPKLKEIKIPIFLMMGNDDFRINMDSLEKEEKRGTFRLIHNKINKINSHYLVGYSFVNELPFLLKDWEKMDNKNSKPLTDEKFSQRTVKKEQGTIEDDINKLPKSDPKKTIYVFHAPPFNTNLDMVNPKTHVGSKSIRRFIEEKQPFLTLHGHIHESVEASGEYMEKIGETISINPGSYYLDNLLNITIIDLETLDIEHEMI